MNRIVKMLFKKNNKNKLNLNNLLYKSYFHSLNKKRQYKQLKSKEKRGL
jgi:hypothetical protein